MKKLLILPILAISLTACKNKTEKEPTATEVQEAETMEPITSLLERGCYSYDANDNVINLEITGVEKGVTGTLNYELDGKDSNSGTFVGTVHEDKLFGTYTFMSEGVESTREIAFLIKDRQLVEGYGPLNETGTAFADRNNINYASTMPLAKTDCDN